MCVWSLSDEKQKIGSSEFYVGKKRLPSQSDGQDVFYILQNKKARLPIRSQAPVYVFGRSGPNLA